MNKISIFLCLVFLYIIINCSNNKNIKGGYIEDSEDGHTYISTIDNKKQVYVERDLIVKGNIKNQHNQNIFPRGMIIIWHPTTSNIPKGWAICDGKNGTPDLRNRFITGTAVDNKQGAVNTKYYNGLVKLHPNNIPSHTHSAIIHKTNTNHQHTGRTGHMTRNHVHRHSTLHCSMNDNNGHNWYAGGDDNRGCHWRQDFMHHTDTNHQHDFRTNWMDRNAEHSHGIKINATGLGHAFDIKPNYYKLIFIMKL